MVPQDEKPYSMSSARMGPLPSYTSQRRLRLPAAFARRSASPRMNMPTPRRRASDATHTQCRAAYEASPSGGSGDSVSQSAPEERP